MKTKLYVGAIACLLLATGCGGGGGGGSTSAGLGTAATSGTSLPWTAALASKEGEASFAGEAMAVKSPAPSTFPREHTYRFFSANGSEQMLRLSFQTRRYELLGGNTSVVGTFDEDADEAGTFIFRNTRVSGNYNTARFRITDGAVIGAFPVPRAYTNPPQFDTLPFVAANDFISDGAEVDGDYGLLETSRTSLGLGGGPVTMRISGGGATMTTCTGEAYWPDICPDPFRRSYALSRRGDAWHATATANSKDQFDFRIARIAGEKVYLGTGTYVDLLESTQFERKGLRIGLPVADHWPQSHGVGSATGAAWGTYSIDGYQLTTTAIDAAGQPHRVEAKVSEAAVALPNFFPPLRTLHFVGSDRPGFAMQNNTLMLAWAPAGIQAGLSIALVSGVHADKREGAYTLFGLNGRRYALQLNFENKTYAISTDTGAPAAAGTFRPQSNFGSYEWVDQTTGSASGQGYFFAANDAVIGNVPLPGTSGGTTSLVAFVAARSFLTLQTELSALSAMYGHWFALGNGAPGLPPVNQSIGINGTSMAVCMWMFPVGVSAVPCPPEGLQTLSIVPADRPGAWLAVAPGSPPGAGEEFQVARIGGDLVYLSAGAGVFKIGLDISSSAPPWKTMITLGSNVATNTPLAPIQAQFSCLYTDLGGDPPLDSCSRMSATSMFETLPMDSSSPRTSPVRTATLGAAGTYVIHQGRTLLVVRRTVGAGADGATELGIGMTP